MNTLFPGEKKYPHIFSPIQIGKVWVKNRSGIEQAGQNNVLSLQRHSW